MEGKEHRVSIKLIPGIQVHGTTVHKSGGDTAGMCLHIRITVVHALVVIHRVLRHLAIAWRLIVVVQYLVQYVFIIGILTVVVVALVSKGDDQVSGHFRLVRCGD